jgi:hypothetical protein
MPHDYLADISLKRIFARHFELHPHHYHTTGGPRKWRWQPPIGHDKALSANKPMLKEVTTALAEPAPPSVNSVHDMLAVNLAKNPSASINSLKCSRACNKIRPLQSPQSDRIHARKIACERA